MKLSQTYWEDRYDSQSTGWDIGHASRPLRSYINHIQDKSLRILIPGSGNGHEALYLLEQGFSNVSVVDMARQPLELIQEKVGNDDRINLFHSNYFDHAGRYDIILEQTFFCAIELRFRESYFKKTHELLTENGILAGVWFDFEEKRIEPPFGGSAQEYRHLCRDLFHIHHLERCYNSEPSRQGKELFIELLKK